MYEDNENRKKNARKLFTFVIKLVIMIYVSPFGIIIHEDLFEYEKEKIDIKQLISQISVGSLIFELRSEIHNIISKLDVWQQALIYITSPLTLSILTFATSTPILANILTSSQMDNLKKINEDNFKRMSYARKKTYCQNYNNIFECNETMGNQRGGLSYNEEKKEDNYTYYEMSYGDENIKYELDKKTTIGYIKFQEEADLLVKALLMALNGNNNDESSNLYKDAFKIDKKSIIYQSIVEDSIICKLLVFSEFHLYPDNNLNVSTFTDMNLDLDVDLEVIENYIFNNYDNILNGVSSLDTIVSDFIPFLHIIKKIFGTSEDIFRITLPNILKTWGFKLDPARALHWDSYYTSIRNDQHLINYEKYMLKSHLINTLTNENDNFSIVIYEKGLNHEKNTNELVKYIGNIKGIMKSKNTEIKREYEEEKYDDYPSDEDEFPFVGGNNTQTMCDIIEYNINTVYKSYVTLNITLLLNKQYETALLPDTYYASGIFSYYVSEEDKNKLLQISNVASLNDIICHVNRSNFTQFTRKDSNTYAVELFNNNKYRITCEYNNILSIFEDDIMKFKRIVNIIKEKSSIQKLKSFIEKQGHNVTSFIKGIGNICGLRQKNQQQPLEINEEKERDWDKYIKENVEDTLDLYELYKINKSNDGFKKLKMILRLPKKIKIYENNNVLTQITLYPKQKKLKRRTTEDNWLMSYITTDSTDFVEQIDEQYEEFVVPNHKGFGINIKEMLSDVLKIAQGPPSIKEVSNYIVFKVNVGKKKTNDIDIDGHGFFENEVNETKEDYLKDIIIEKTLGVKDYAIWGTKVTIELLKTYYLFGMTAIVSTTALFGAIPSGLVSLSEIITKRLTYIIGDKLINTIKNKLDTYRSNENKPDLNNESIIPEKFDKTHYVKPKLKKNKDEQMNNSIISNYISTNININDLAGIKFFWLFGVSDVIKFTHKSINGMFTFINNVKYREGVITNIKQSSIFTEQKNEVIETEINNENVLDYNTQLVSGGKQKKNKRTKKRGLKKNKKTKRKNIFKN